MLGNIRLQQPTQQWRWPHNNAQVGRLSPPISRCFKPPPASSPPPQTVARKPEAMVKSVATASAERPIASGGDNGFAQAQQPERQQGKNQHEIELGLKSPQGVFPTRRAATNNQCKHQPDGGPVTFPDPTTPSASRKPQWLRKWMKRIEKPFPIRYSHCRLAIKRPSSQMWVKTIRCSLGAPETGRQVRSDPEGKG